MFKTTIQRVSFPKNRRILMVSDIHAHADDLKAVLKKAGFCENDILVIVGDLIERGTQSLETIRFVMRLVKTHTVYPLMGNVDLWRLSYLLTDQPEKLREFQRSSLKCAEWWQSSLLHEMCAEIGAELTADTDLVSLFPRLRQHFAPEIAFLQGLPTILESRRFIFVHGGIPHERLDELAGKDAYPLLKYDGFYCEGLSFRKYVVVGHWPAVLYSPTYPDFGPLIDRERRIVCLDGACGVKHEGQLNLLAVSNEDSDDFTLTTQDHLPIIRALEDQSASPEASAVFICWSDRWVDIVEKGEEMSLVRHHERLVRVPTQYLGQQDGRDYCRDATNYRLPVRAGEKLLLVLALSEGCIAKKRGVEGWYFGKYEHVAEVKKP